MTCTEHFLSLFLFQSLFQSFSYVALSPSNGWWDNFLLNNPEVRLKIAKKIDRLHAFAANPYDVVEFFDILKEIYEYIPLLFILSLSPTLSRSSLFRNLLIRYHLIFYSQNLSDFSEVYRTSLEY